MIEALLICVAAFFILVWHSRLVGVTLGLPIAYLFALLFNHLPGAFAHWVNPGHFNDSTATEFGLQMTTIGTVCFVFGVVLAQRFTGKRAGKSDYGWLHFDKNKRFAIFCLFGGWITVIVSQFFGSIPSLGAAIDHGAAIWILGVVIGFLGAVQKKRPGQMLLWLAALSVYPLFVLIHGGFLSFGSTSVFIVLSALLVMVKRHVRAYGGVVLVSLVFFFLFLSYFQNRNDIRDAVWGGAGLEQRISCCTTIITDFGWFHADNPNQLDALDERMNQNKFVGMAAQKISSDEKSFLHGYSVWQGLEALVPRVLWPAKPVFAGSSQYIRDFTDFQVNDSTSFGVGQVMEFYINFGIPGVAVGFLLFGFAYGWIDRTSAAALQRGESPRSIIWFLVGVGMNAPLASIAEIMGNIAAAAVAGYSWHLLFGWIDEKTPTPARRRRRKQVDGPARRPTEAAHSVTGRRD